MINIILISLFFTASSSKHIVANPIIEWPEDFMICVSNASEIPGMIHPNNLEDPFRKPLVSGGDCVSGYGTSYSDSEFDFNLCTKILRTWTVLSWCTPPKQWTHVQIIKVIIKDGEILPCD